jgi:hypothetical protein
MAGLGQLCERFGALRSFGKQVGEPERGGGADMTCEIIYPEIMARSLVLSSAFASHMLSLSLVTQGVTDHKRLD